MNERDYFELLTECDTIKDKLFLTNLYLKFKEEGK